MTDLITRLRDDERAEWAICKEAADEIEHLMLDLQTERAAVVALRAELDALREDAARYRWLKTHRYEMDTLYRYANTDVFERELDLNIRNGKP